MTLSPKLYLASKSKARARLLTAAGLSFEIVSASVDEDTIKDAMLAEGAPPAHVADTLAELKALRGSSVIAAKIPGSLVIGSDQVLVHKGVLFSKPESLADAKDQLNQLRGSQHELITAAVVARDGTAIWRFMDRARLQMRNFSDAFIDRYIEAIGARALLTVGCYEIEGRGVTLFSKIEGDPYTIQGLPILALLAFLREHGIADA